MVDYIQTQGIIVQTAGYGETSLIIDVFTEDYGLIKGYAKSARQKKYSGIYQKGNLIELSHQRRLPEQLGQITADLITCYWADFAMQRMHFKIFTKICDLFALILPQFVRENILYTSLSELLILLSETTSKTLDVKRAYVDFLYLFLQQIGYGPDFSRCAVSGSCIDVIYVSPKTAQAISRPVAAHYADRLFILPVFLQDYRQGASDHDLENAIKIMQLCFRKFIFEAKNMKPIDLFLD